MRRTMWLVAVVVLSGTAHAKPADVVAKRLDVTLRPPGEDLKPARFGFASSGVKAPPTTDDGEGDLSNGFDQQKRVVGFSANGEAAWLSADLAWYDVCGDETCSDHPKPSGYYHATALFEGGAPWQPVMWHLAVPMTGKDYAASVKRGHELEEVPASAKGADAVVGLFESTIGVPAAFAKTVSTRADVVLYGTDRKERVVGGKKVAARLATWSLALAVHGGLQAGVTASGTVAWIAANVDATSTKKPGAKPTPYRLTAIYEKTDAGWQIVNLHFSFEA